VPVVLCKRLFGRNLLAFEAIFYTFKLSWHMFLHMRFIFYSLLCGIGVGIGCGANASDDYLLEVS